MPEAPSIEGQPKQTFLKTYAERVASFSRNARLYLWGAVLSGIAMGVFQLLFNFYVLSLGFDAAVLGNLVTIRSATGLLAALPMGYLTDRVGRKNAFLTGTFLMATAIAMMLFFPRVWIFISMSIVMGVAQSLSGVAMGPFLMENSEEKERTYLFSFSSGISMTSNSIGQWVGGYLPTWFGTLFMVSAQDTKAYAWAIGASLTVSLLTFIPNLMLTNKRSEGAERSVFAPLAYAREDPKGLSRLILPMLITSIGAGMIMPFMNVFFRTVHHQSDSAIGVMFAWGSLAMGLGLLIAPPLAEKYGKIQIVVVTQALSIPFLALLGFSPIFVISLAAYYLRVLLMNMSGPIYSTFVMEQVQPKHRAMLASLSSMAHNFGWAFSPTISGYIQVRWGFQPAFMFTIVFYIVAITMYYLWFWKGRAKPSDLPARPVSGS